MKKFYSLNIHQLTIVNLAGLSNETIIAGKAAGAALGLLGETALSAFVGADSAFRVNLISNRSSQLTAQIKATDSQRDGHFAEIRRTVTAASKSSAADTAAAGQTLATFLYPYGDVHKEPLMSETSTFNFLQTQYEADPELQNAAAVLNLTAVFANLFAANTLLSDLWNGRASEDAKKSAPSPTSLKKNLKTCYRNFCDVVLKTLDLQPSTELENLYSVMNGIRIKYAKSLPVRLTAANTSVAPIETQPHTGQPVTPIPRVFLKLDGEVRELRFTVDFYITYRHNTDAGEAQLIVHGKGKYSGSYISTFHIASGQ